MSRDSKWVLTD